MIIDEKQLFDDLVALCEHPDYGFYMVDREYQGIKYRIFSYRLIGSYTMWLLPNALNCRGTMFAFVNGEWKLVCLPMEKFFRIHENPLTMNIDIKDPNWEVYEKVDGSLISSFINPATNDVDFKSKTSLNSDHVIVARRLINHPKNEHFKQYCLQREQQGFTVNMELISEDPNLRVVVPYTETALKVLCERNRHTGQVTQLLPRMNLQRLNPLDKTEAGTLTLLDAIQYCETLTGIEGFVAFNPQTNQTVKMKTVWYDNLHTTKSSLDSVDHVMRLILTETIDDFKSLFEGDVGVIKRITTIEEAVVPVYNTMVFNATTFYNNNKHLDRKSYAILAKSSLNDFEFKMAMEIYLGRSPDFVDYLIKNKNKYFNITTIGIENE